VATTDEVVVAVSDELEQADRDATNDAAMTAATRICLVRMALLRLRSSWLTPGPR
jgi:hypothetical protein